MTPLSPDSDVLELFALAVELDPLRRTKLLDERCAGRPDLRLEIESLLSADTRSGAFLRSPLERWRRSNPDEDQPLAEGEGDQIGPYALVRRLAEGGCGVVFLAERRAPVVQRVALKIIRPQLGSSGVIAAFEAERQALAMMDHPNIARLFDAGLSPSGRPYFVMEYIEGDRITAHCRKTGATVRERLEIFLTVCSAVQHAHGRGIIHRDIKPGNVLVATNANISTPKVIDFGVAKALQAQSGVLEVVSVGLGTPAYMSPEQAEGGADLDTRTDVYGLGALLYELLFETPPFDSTALAQMTREELCRFLRINNPPNRSGRRMPVQPATRGGDRIPPELELIPLKAMRRDSVERYRSADELADDVRSFLARRPLIAADRTPLYVARKYLSRHRQLIALLVLLVVGFALGIGAVWRAEMAKVEERLEADRARALSNLLFDSMLMASPGFAGGSTTTAGQTLEFARRLDHGALAHEPKLEVAVRALVGKNLAGYAMYAADARRHLERAQQLLAAEGGPEADTKTLDAVAQGWLALGLSERAEAIWSTRLSRLAGRGESTSRASAETMLALAQSKAARHDLVEAERLARAASDSFEKAGDSDGLAEASRLLALVISETSGRAVEAIPPAARSLELCRARRDDMGVGVMLCLHTLGIVHKRADDLDAAERFFREAIASDGFAGLGNHRWTAALTRDLANLLWERSRFDEAEGFARRAVEIDRSLAPDVTGLPTSLNRMGAILRATGKLDDAEKAYREELSILERPNPDPRELAAAQTGLAETLCRSGRDGAAQEAADLARSAIQLRTAYPERTSYSLRNSRVVLATALAHAGNSVEAAAQLDAALEGLERDSGVSTARRRKLLGRAADAYDLIGEPQRAAECRGARNGSSHSDGEALGP